MTTLLYDGTFEGFLTAVFEAYARRLADVRLRPAHTSAAALFGDSVFVPTEEGKAARVWKGVKDKTNTEGARRLYCNFLSELEGEEDNLLEYLRYVFDSTADVSEDYSHPAVLRVAKVMKMVGREKHRMEAFVRFQLGSDGIYHAVIEPDFNVLPLIVKHFQNRYADQRWIIFDRRRQYGMYYDLQTVRLVQADEAEAQATASLSRQPVEVSYQQLWKTYFRSTNIKERRNLKLHLQHVPVRYWKYLSEKQPA